MTITIPKYDKRTFVSANGTVIPDAELAIANANPLLIARGVIEGASIMSAMGEFESGNIDAAGEDVCHFELVSGPARLPTPAAAGERMYIVSSAIADTGTSSPLGTGTQTVSIHYIDATGNEQDEIVTLNGTTPVPTVATNIRFVNDMHTQTVGTGGVAAGNISLYKHGGAIGTDLYNLIALGGNKSLVPHRMVPLGKTLYLQSWHCEQSTATKRAAFRIRSTDMYGVLIPGVFCFKDVSYIGMANSGPQDLHGTPVPALSIVKVSQWSDTTGTEGSCGWWGILIDD